MWPIHFIVWALVPASIPVHAFSANGSSSSISAIKDLSRRNDDLHSEFAGAVIRGEKFFFDYWDFEGADEVGLTTNETHSSQSYDNHEAPEIQPRAYPFRPSVPINMGFSPLLRRDFKCPTGTFACTAIDRPDSCCGAGDTCVLVQDTGLGDVGCCPQGQTCSGVIGSCQQGYMSCPASMGACVSGGCANVFTVTITLSSTVIVSTGTRTVPPETTQSASSSTSSSRRTTTQSTGGLTPPARPTSLSTATTSQSSQTGSICPTGFYACSAYYEGGCCRTGRDCDTTSCPAKASSTITSDGRTIVVPAQTTSAASGTGRCASGWFSCADTVGGGCCPTGYACGSSCTAVASVSASGTLAKSQPENAASRHSIRAIWAIGALGMMILWI
ncbi:putative GPI anchored protein [Aspergillus novofumigatus IBT 16806]|uniref:Putative GPI anchored protein n=1 Tax=Aspergillus novofumigatus (strain IBT 16806) TaxID=1392255 RepID=A0A2I1C9W8_ASPN1|nr:putative GPI anchored protein [Aspergillus novofumigatus IBT 16806]PKX94404.1 putative GPI anchored protein [Aspergillus novofumigatus IBT 16806]